MWKTFDEEIPDNWYLVKTRDNQLITCFSTEKKRIEIYKRWGGVWMPLMDAIKILNKENENDRPAL